GTTWVYIMLGIYIVYCFYWGLKGYFTDKSSKGYAIAGRSIPFFAFLLSATAASFSGWTFIGHPGLIWRDGLAYAFASFYVLTIPITGTFFSKRTWLLGKRYGFVTPGDMYAYYYNNEFLRFLVVMTAVLYSIFYSAVQLMAAGALFNVIAGVPVTFGCLFLAFIVWFYVCTGGLKASTWVGVIQFILLVGGIVILGFYVLGHFNGWSNFSAEVMKLESKYLEVPKVINIGLGGGWTAVMILSYMFALMGIQSSPAFTMWTFGIKSPKPLAWQQAFMSTFVVGFALFFFTAFQGMGAKILQETGLGLTPDQVEIFKGLNNRNTVPILMQQFLPPFMLGVVFIGAIAAIHSTAAPYIGTGGSILLRDIYWRYIKKKDCSDAEQIWVNRILATVLTIAALVVGLTSKAALVILGALATAYGFVMYVLLLGVIWGVRFPTIGAVLGVLAGMISVYVTYDIFKYPLSMHCAFWGTGVGLFVAFVCRGIGLKDTEETIKRQAEVRSWLDSVDEPSESGKAWRKIMKIWVPVWYIFAIGPACILGNTAFSLNGFPHLWSWQIVWWIIGIVMMWALCFKAEMATTNEEQIRRADEETMEVIEEG
ncbi:MAG: sodium:solute symporter family protein, partial [Desulfobacterales bacterium]|nr:sodium:solute symporter family protein [Desulfobacterales bacterium]